MRFRKLRIVWSVFCGLACVLLIVLWVRSYWYRETVEKVDAAGLSFCSIERGSLQIGKVLGSVIGGVGRWGTNRHWTTNRERIGPTFTTTFGITVKQHWIFIPLWFPVLLSAVFGALPWIRWRFRL